MKMLIEEPDFKVSDDQAPDFELSGKLKRKNESSGIVGLMKMLIEDLENEIKNGQKDEDEAQLEFDKNLAAAKKVVKELTDENDYKAEIKPDCDWIVENFDKRDKHREAEMKGLTEAKEYLAGASPSGFLQRVVPHSLHGH